MPPSSSRNGGAAAGGSSKSSRKKRRKAERRRSQGEEVERRRRRRSDPPPPASTSAASSSSVDRASGKAAPPPRAVSAPPVRTVDFVYPRSGSSGQRRAEATPFVFSRKKKKAAEDSEGSKEERGEVEGNGDETGDGSGANRSKDTLEDILYPQRKMRREDAAKKEEETAAAAANESKSGKKKKKRKRKRSMDASDAEDGTKNGGKASVGHRLIPDAYDPPQETALPTPPPSQTKESKRRRLEPEVPLADRGSPIVRQLSGTSVEEAVRDKFGCRPRSNSTDGELGLPRRGLCDEHAVLKAHRWDLERLYINGGSGGRGSSRAAGPKQPRGLGNMGNTCYLNATLQCLAYLPTFCQIVAVLPPPDDDNRSKGKKIAKGKQITLILRGLLRRMHCVEAAEGGAYKTSAIQPKAIVGALPKLSSSSRGYKFRPGRQEDAHEFLVHLLDAMNDGELREAGINQRVSGWRDRLPIPRLDETSFVHRIFGGYLRSQVKCMKCGYSSNTYDPFLDLSLEVSKKKANSIASAFADFTQKEQLDEDNKWRCSGCKKRVRAIKQLTVFRPPLSLVIQLKRFTFAGGGSGGLAHYHGGGHGYGHYPGKGMGFGGRGGSKITKPIEFPADLKLSLSDGRRCVYVLTGMVVHVGGSATSGHYTALVKKPSHGGGTPSKWFHMDDSFVEPVSEKAVMRQKDAYVLFYCRKEVKLEIPSPPPRASMTASEAMHMGESRARARAESITSLGSSSQKSPPAQSHESPPSKTNRSPSSSSPPPSSSSSGSEESESESSDDGSSGEGEEYSSVRKKLDGAMGKYSDKVNGGKETEIALPQKSQAERHSSSSSTSSSAPSSSSEDSDSDSDSGSDSDSDPGSDTVGDDGKPDQNPQPALLPSSKKKKERIVSLDQGRGRGKVQVKLGVRKKFKPWKPVVGFPTQNRSTSSNELLGNLNVGTWDDDADVDDTVESSNSFNKMRRKKGIQAIESERRAQKRSMHMNRWDAALDEGKTKKVKIKSGDDFVEPKFNQFQRLQSDLLRKNKGRAKGDVGKEPHSLPKKKKDRNGGERKRRSY